MQRWDAKLEIANRAGAGEKSNSGKEGQRKRDKKLLKQLNNFNETTQYDLKFSDLFFSALKWTF